MLRILGRLRDVAGYAVVIVVAIMVWVLTNFLPFVCLPILLVLYGESTRNFIDLTQLMQAGGWLIGLFSVAFITEATVKPLLWRRIAIPLDSWAREYLPIYILPPHSS